MLKDNNHKIVDYDKVLDAEFGKPGSLERNQSEEETYAFYVGQILKDCRKEAGMTQSQLAQKISSTKSYISRVENGDINPSATTLFRIVAALGKEVSFIASEPLVNGYTTEGEKVSRLSFAEGSPQYGGRYSVSDTIRNAIIRKGMSQTELAGKLGISPSRINDYIHGRSEPTLKVARELCYILDIPAEEMLGVF